MKQVILHPLICIFYFKIINFLFFLYQNVKKFKIIKKIILRKKKISKTNTFYAITAGFMIFLIQGE